MTYLVLRPFRSDRLLAPGEAFDASSGHPRRIASLMARGYLAPLPDEREPAARRRSRRAVGEPETTPENAPGDTPLGSLAEGTNDA